MDTQDDKDAPAVITATGLGVDGEHGPLFSGIDLALPEGFHAIQMPGGPGQTTLLMTLAGRFKPTHGTADRARRYEAAGDSPALRDRRFPRHRRTRGVGDRADGARRAAAVAGALVRADTARGRPVQDDRSIRRHPAAVPGYLHRRIVRSGAVFAADHAGDAVKPSDPGGRRSRTGTRQRTPRHRGRAVGRARRYSAPSSSG